MQVGRERAYMSRIIGEVRRGAGVDGLDEKTGYWGMGEVKEKAPEEGQERVLNRKERRMQKKAGGGAAGNGGAATPPIVKVDGGKKKKVIAENGKQFVVNERGDVYLVAEDEEGEVEELLLDPRDIEDASWRKVVWVTLPMWVWGMTVGRVLGVKEEEEGEEVEEMEGETGEEREKRVREAKERSERRKRVRQRKAGKQ